MLDSNPNDKPVSLSEKELKGIVPREGQGGNALFFTALSKDKGTVIAPRGQSNEPITVQAIILNDDVKVHVKIPPYASLEDRRIANFIEGRILEGFAKYHSDKKQSSIDV